MLEAEALQQAREQIKELVESARAGTIIPVRLPGQLEAIADLLAAKDDSQDVTAGAAAAVSGDVQEIMQQNASFVSTAVHELRTPMTNIRGYSDMLASGSLGELDEMQLQFLGVIRSNVRRMEGLMEDVSFISKIRADSLKLGVKMDMFKNIGMMLEKETRPIAEELERELQFEIAEGLPLLNTDGELLAKALRRLVENGLRYIEGEGGKVTVSARGDGNKLIIAIQDNGIGMSTEDLAQLGTLFFRSEEELVRTYKGSGLGIPVAYGIIKALDGEVAVESAPDQGSTFTVTLTGMT